MKNQNIVDVIITGTNGKTFSVVYTRKDGTQGKAVARIGVKKYLKGGASTFNGKHNDKGNIGLFFFTRDNNGRFNGGVYRALNNNRISVIKHKLMLKIENNSFASLISK